MNPKPLEAGMREARVLVCAGTGGVGKTTIAAALALESARMGRRTLVLTIDPARRLADALGESVSGSAAAKVDLGAIFEDEERVAGGSLDAVMLDPKPTFDRLITRLTEDPTARRRILENRIYRHLSEALAGSAEYAAMEQVHEFVESGGYDLVVVDTPPSGHALDFLSAPRRLREFLDSRFFHALVRPAMSAGRFGFRLFGRPLHRMIGLLERIAGVGFLDDLAEFLQAIDGLSEGFQERARRVESVLLGGDTRFVLICSPGANSDASTLEFLDELDSLRVRLNAIVVNRVQPWPLEISAAKWRVDASQEGLARDTERLQDLLLESGDARAEVHAAQAVAILRESAFARDLADQTIASLSARVAARDVSCHSVPELSDDMDRQGGLRAIGRALFPEPSPGQPGPETEARSPGMET